MDSIAKKVGKHKRISYDDAFAINGKTPPQALELEESVLGALMLDQNALTNTIEIIKPEYFYKPEHQTIFKAIVGLFEKSQPVDILTVVDALRSAGELELAGGAYYVSQLTNRVVSAAHIEYHARILSEKFIQRELIRVSTETLTESYDETTDVIDLLDKTEQRLMDITENNFRRDYSSMSSIMKVAYDQIEKSQANESGVSGIPTGFIELDRATAGFQRGTLIILAARPAMGKTAFALSLAKNMALDFDKPVAFFSLEMTAVELAMRLISSESEIKSEKFKKGGLEEWEKQQLYMKTERLNKAPIYIDDTPQLTIFELRAKCRRLKQRYGIEMVFIDYLQLMHGGSESKGGNREQEISTISRQLKALSKELNIPILALSQLSRAVETRGGDKRPQLSDLRESGAIEQDADIVMFIYRPEYYNIDSDEKGSTLGKADIILAKHRSGSTDTIRLRFIKNFTRFENDTFEIENMNTGFAPNENFDGGGMPSQTFESKMNADQDVPF
ncbi:MAG: replicative DNA helicase [Bacteroidales bacterium]|nr:replicative DNA helicase [Bacteroidales bacterium]